MRNKKFAAFFNRKSYIVAVVIMVVAAFGMTGLYYAQQEREQEAQLAKERERQVQQGKRTPPVRRLPRKRRKPRLRQRQKLGFRHRRRKKKRQKRCPGL